MPAPRRRLVAALATIVCSLLTSAASHAQSGYRVATGTYVGNGQNRTISGVGFQPNVVFVKREDSEPTIVRTSSMPNDQSKILGSSSSLSNNRIRNFTTDGFGLTNDDDVNKSGFQYHWIAFRAAAGALALGSYNGKGNVWNITGIGFKPEYVMILPSESHHASHRFASTVGDSTFEFGDTGPFTNRIRSFLADGFQLGTSNTVNDDNDKHYHYIAWKTVPGGLSSGVYTSTGVPREIHEPAFAPQWALIKQIGPTRAVHRSATVTGDLTFSANNKASFTNGIVGLLPTGFQIGTHPAVNDSGLSYLWTAFEDPVQADLALNQFAAYSRANVGDTVRFTVDLMNYGPDPGTVITVTDLLPTSLDLTLASATVGSYDSSNGFWSLDTLPASTTARLVLEGRVKPGTGGSNVTNDAAVTAVVEPDFAPGSEQDAASIWIRAANLSADIATSDGRPDVGDTLTLIYTVANAGPDTATRVQVQAALPPELVYLSNTPSRGTYGLDGIWTLGTLRSGRTETLQLRAVVAPGTAGTSFLSHTSIANLDQEDPASANDRDSVSVYVRLADLSLTCTADRPRPAEGDTVAFTVVLANAGPDTATSIQVHHFLPPGMTYISNTRSTGTFTSGSGLWSIPSLRSTFNATLTVRARVATGNAGKTLIDSARVTTAQQFDPDAADRRDTARVVVRGADLAVSKTVDDPTPSLASFVEYTVVVRNLGPDAATGVRVDDSLPTGVSYFSHSVSQGTYTFFSGVWNVGSVALGDSATLTIQGVVDGSGGATVTNTATRSAGSPIDPVAANNSASAPIAVNGAEVAITKRSDRAHPAELDTVRFTLVMKNKGPQSATGVQVTDPLPAGFTFLSATGSGTYSAPSGLWTLGSVASGDSAKIVLITRVATGAGGQTLVNTATITARDKPDPVAANDTARVVIPVLGADLEVTFSAHDSTANAGDTLVHRVVVRNLGPDPAAGVVLTHALSAGLSTISAVPSRGTYGAGTWNVGALATGDSAALVVHARVSPSVVGGVVVHGAQRFSSSIADPVAANNADTASVRIRSADLIVAHDAWPGRVDRGDTVTFRTVVRNLGPDGATNVDVASAPTAPMSLLGAIPSQGFYHPVNGWSIGSIAAGDSAVLIVDTEVGSGAAGTVHVSGAAIAGSAEADPTAADRSDDASVYVRAADLALSSTAAPPNPSVGDTVTITIALANAGPDTANAVQVANLLPAELELVSSTVTSGALDSLAGPWNIPMILPATAPTWTLRALVSPSAASRTLVDSARVLATIEEDPTEADRADTAVVAIRGADLAISLSASDAAPVVHDTLTITLTVDNAGPDPANAIAIAAPLPAGLAYVDHTATHGGWIPATGVWTISSLSIEGSAALTVRVVATPDAPPSRSVSATRTSSDPVDPEPDNDGSALTIDVRGAEQAITLLADRSEAVELDTVTFSLALRNHGPEAASATVVAAPLPAGMSFLSATGAGVDSMASGVWTPGAIAPGDSAVATITARIGAGTAATTLHPTIAIAASAEPDPIAGNDTSRVSVRVRGADLSLLKTASRPSANPGDTVRFELVVRNAGPDPATAVDVEDVLPPALAFVGVATSQGAYDSGGGHWAVGTLAAGDSATLALDASLDPGSGGNAIVNVASASAFDIDPTPGDRSDSASVYAHSADLALSVGVDHPRPDVGDTLTFTLQLANAGPDTATAIAVTHALPAGLEHVSHDASAGAYDTPGGAWTIPALAPAATVSLSVRARVTPAAAARALVDSARVTFAVQGDPDAADRADTALVVVRGADLGVAIAVDDAGPVVRDTIRISVTLRDFGPDAADTASIACPLPAGLTHVGSSATNGTWSPGTGLWNLAGVAAGDSATLSIDAVVGLVPSLALVAARASSAPWDSSTANDSATVVLIVRGAKLAIALASDRTEVAELDTVTFALALRNAGPESATGVLVDAVLPLGMTFLSSTGDGSWSAGQWTPGTIAAGDSAQLAVAVRVDAGTAALTLAHAATIVVRDQPDPVAADDTAQVAVRVRGADLVVSISADDPTPVVYDTAMVRVAVRNAGPDSAGAIQIDVPMTAGLTRVDHTAGQGTWSPGTGAWTIASLAPGDSADLAIRVAADPGPPPLRTLTASRSASTPEDPVSIGDTAAVTLDVQGAELALEMRADRLVVAELDTVTFTLALHNAGPQTASGTAVAALLPAGLTFVSAVGAGSYSDASGAWTPGTIAAADSAVIAIGARVDAGTSTLTLTHAGVIAVRGEPDPIASNDSASASVRVRGADLSLGKTVSPAVANAGDTVRFTLVVRNAGPDPASAIEVGDALPAGLTDAGATASQGVWNSGAGIWTVGTLAAGDSATLALDATLDAGTGGNVIVNVAAASAFDVDPTPADRSDSAAVYVRSADLALSVAVDRPRPDVGDTLTFVLAITNAGPDTATAVAIANTLPSELELVSSSAGAGTFDEPTGTWTIAAVAPGETPELSLRARVTPGAAARTLVDSARIAFAIQGDPDAGDRADTALVIVRGADLAVAIAVDDSSPVTGDTVRVSVRLRNEGPDRADAAEIAFALPAGLSHVASTASAGSWTQATGAWTLTGLAAGDSAVLTIDAEAGLVPALSLEASRTSSAPWDSASANDSASVALAVRGTELSIAVRTDRTVAAELDTVTFTVALRNAGPETSTGGAVAAPLPAGTSLLSATGAGSYANGQWSLDAIAAGDSAVIALVARVLAGTASLTLTHAAAIAGSDQPDPVAANDTAFVSVRIRGADLSLRKRAVSPVANSGDTIRFQLVVHNAGPDSATSLIVDDALPAGLAHHGATGSQGTYDSGAGRWSVGTVAPGDSATLDLDVAIAAGTGGQTIVNAASASAFEVDPTPGDRSDTAAVYVRSSDLALNVRVDRPRPGVGDTLTFTLTLSNGGPDAATGVSISNALPAGLALASNVPSAGTYDVPSGRWTIAAVPGGNAPTLALRARVESSAAARTLVDSARVLSADQEDPDSGDRADTATVAVLGADLEVAIAVDDAAPVVGDTLRIAITLRNHGPDAVGSAAIACPLPSGLTHVTHAASRGTWSPAGGTWSIASLAVGDSASLVVKAAIDGTPSLGVTAARASSAPWDPQPANDSVAVAIATRGARLSLALRSDRAVAGERDTLGWTLVLRNDGPQASSAASVRDSLAPGLELLSAAGDGVHDGVLHRWLPGAIAAGDSAVLAMAVRVGSGTAAQTLPGRAWIASAGEPDPIAADDSSGVVVTVLGADLSLEMRARAPRVDPADSAAFAVTLRNAGPDAAHDVQVDHPLPPGLVLAGATTSAGAFDVGTRRWSLPVLAPGDSAHLMLLASIAAGQGGRTLVHRGAIAFAREGDPAPGDRADSAGVYVRAADLSVAAAATTASMLPGDTVTFRVRLGNAGPDTATGVALTVVAPPELAVVSASTAGGAFAGGIWSPGAIAAGDSAVLTLGAQILDAAAGRAVASSFRATDVGPEDANAANDTSVVTFAVGANLAVQVLPQNPSTLRPGTPGVEVLRVRVSNATARAETLTSLRLANRIVSAGTTAQRDASWSPLALETTGGAALATTSFAGGDARFTGLSVLVPAHGMIELAVRGGASLHARDGDALDLAPATATDFGYSRPLYVVANGGLDPAGNFVVDGMTAAQIVVEPVGAGVFFTGTRRNLALRVVLPPNGWAPDLLQRLNVVQTGSALDATEVIAVEAWADDGDGALEVGADTRIGALTFTGGRWEITSIAVPVPASGLRVLVTCDIAELADPGGTVRFELPAWPEDAIAMASGNDGPLDQPAGEGTSFGLGTSDRVTWSASAETGGIAAPGTPGLHLLHLVASNTYPTPTTLTTMTVRHFSTGAGSVEQLDDALVRVTLRADGDGDGILDDEATDPPIGTGTFANGRLTFNGLEWSLSPGQTRHLFVTGQTSLGGAADGDEIAVRLEASADLRFEEQVAVAARWPLDSNIRWRIDGMVAAQLLSPPTPVATLGPGEGPALAFDVVVPRNGYRDDALRGVRLRNLGTAAPADLAELRLWRDGGDGDFDAGAGDDVDLGAFDASSGDWVSPLLDQPVTLGGLRLFAAARASATPSDSATVQLELPVGGVTMESDHDGPIDLPLPGANAIVLSRSALLGTLALDPPASTIGQIVTARMVVRNVGPDPVTAIAPSALAPQGAGAMTPVSGPTPATLDLAPGGQGTFSWSLRSDAPGDLRVAGNAAGVSAGLARASLGTTSNAHTIYLQASEIDLFPIESMPFSVSRGQQAVVPLSLTFGTIAGNGTSDVELTAIRLRIEDAVGAPLPPAAVLAAVRVQEGPELYVEKTTLETTGGEILLPLSRPIRISADGVSGGQVTASLSLDISPTTVAPNFRLSIPDSGWFAARDATSGAPVTVRLRGSSYPVRSGLARIGSEATRLELTTTTEDRAAARGQQAVRLTRWTLTNADASGLAADVRVGALQLVLCDSTGVAMPPGRFVSRLRLRGPNHVHAERTIAATDDSVVTLALSPLFSAPANAPLELDLEADVASGASLGRFRVRLRDTTHVDARDANNGAPVPVVYGAWPLVGGWVAVQAPAESLVLRRHAGIAEVVMIGQSDVSALAVEVAHPGPAEAGEIRVDSLVIQLRDQLDRPLAPATLATRMRVLRGVTLAGQEASPPATGAAIVVPLTGVRLAPGERETLEVRVDIAPTAPLTFVELRIADGGMLARDVNTGERITISAAPGSELPIESGLARIAAPARELRAGFASAMPPVLAADARTVPMARLDLLNTAPAASGPVRLAHLEAIAAGADRVRIAAGAALDQVEAWIADTLWARVTLGAADSSAILAGDTLRLEPGAAVAVELRGRTRAGTAVRSLRIGCDAGGLGVVQPASALLSVAVQPAPGQSFPFWSETGNFGGVSLDQSYSNFPNPFAAGQQSTTFAFYLESDATVTLRIVSARGEPVRTILDGAPLGPGLHQSHTWDGRNGAGHAVYHGAYVAELTVRYAGGGGARAMRKVAVVR